MVSLPNSTHNKQLPTASTPNPELPATDSSPSMPTTEIPTQPPLMSVTKLSKTPKHFSLMLKACLPPPLLNLIVSTRESKMVRPREIWNMPHGVLLMLNMMPELPLVKMLLTFLLHLAEVLFSSNSKEESRVFLRDLKT